MGSPEDEEGRGYKEDRHHVVISQAFEMGTTEISQSLYEAVMGENPSGVEPFYWSHQTFDCEDGNLLIADVGSYEANAWGLHDMTGNVWEWVWDPYGDYPSESVTDPAGPESSYCRVMRGGSWNYFPGKLRVASRRKGNATGRSDYGGLRIVRSLP